ncbi:MAG: hypothetical protein ABI579_08190 [Candidatus Sumerlaeota bacterium]
MSQYIPPQPQFPQGDQVPPKKKKNPWILALIIGAILALPCIALTGIMIAIAVPSFIRAREVSRKNACQENLVRIDSAKKVWATDTNKQGDSTATPTWSDLTGNGNYLRMSPICPASGNYYINSLGTSPSCSLSNQKAFPHEYPGGALSIPEGLMRNSDDSGS